MRQSCMVGERMMLRRVLDMSTGAIARYGRYARVDDRGVGMEQCRYLLLPAFGIHLQDIPLERLRPGLLIHRWTNSASSLPHTSLLSRCIVPHQCR